MQTELRGIRATRPLRFRALDGAVIDLWHAAGDRGGHGHYSAPYPRAVLFLDDGADAVALSGPGVQGAGISAIYLPADLPIHAEILHSRSFAHVDLHLDATALERRLAGHVAPETLRRPQVMTGAARRPAAVPLLAQALERADAPALLLEGLVLAVLADLFAPVPDDAPAQIPTPEQRPMTGYQLGAVRRLVQRNLHRRVTLDDMAAAAGLSPSWFSHAFKASTGETPHRWQMRLRTEAAAAMMQDAPDQPLAEIALACGFADQAHLGRVFRAAHGLPPAQWRKALMAPAFTAG